MTTATQLPIQPVENPIICSPFHEPDAHWLYDLSTGIPQRMEGRRPASYWYKSQDAKVGAAQMSMFAQEQSDDLPLVNALREDVRRWRESKWESASEITKQLLRHWNREDRFRKLFFCQIEAVETILYLREILTIGKRTRWNPRITQEDYQKLAQGINPRPTEWKATVAQHPRLVDLPNEPGFDPLTRYCCKMATGSGKTVIMSMLISWAFCNRGRVPGDNRYPRNALIVCPNLTIKERLQVLRPEALDNYYDKFDIVPTPLRPELAKGKVLITNWHAFNPESEHSEGGKSYIVVNKGEESDEAFARNRLGDLYADEPILVINDEGHHAYRPAPMDEKAKVNKETEEERAEATIWVSGIDRINNACGVAFCVDLSATPFYIYGSGYPEGSPFPWIVSDFSLVDAIESGITKIPRLPAIDNTGRPDPKFFKLWESITSNLIPGQKLSGGKPKPEVVFLKAQDALNTLASEWKERYELMQSATPGQENIPPVMIIVCDNTQIADYFHKQISGEEELEIDSDADDDDEEETKPTAKKKGKTQKHYGTGKIFPDLLSNTAGSDYTIRIDSNLLAAAESGNPNATRKEAAEALRKVVATVGKPGEAGEKVRCVVSVNMLSEGWDANNVTHILGLRAFGSQLLCEQVVGRGLRRLDYSTIVDPKSGREMLTPEYVDIFGVPFSLIPFKGREPGKSTKVEDRLKYEVKALPERKHYEIQFPMVEGYVVALERSLIRCDVSQLEPTRVDPSITPIAAFIRPQVGIQIGHPSAHGGFGFEEVDRHEYYNSTHPQLIEFEIAREIVRALAENTPSGKQRLRSQSRATLFPQVLRIVQAYIRSKVQIPRGVHPCEIGLETYSKRIIGLLLTAIEPDSDQGEPQILPRLNKYQPIGSTTHVNFKTVKPVQATQKSHLNYVACDTQSWEQAITFRLEASSQVVCYARNDRLEFTIPYEMYGYPQVYEPDFLVKLNNGTTLVLEAKGQALESTDTKHQAAHRWVKAVNHWGKLGKWDFLVCWNPQELEALIEQKI